MLRYLLFIGCFIYAQPQKRNLAGEWMLKRYDAIDKIRSSAAYIYADDNSRSIMDKQFHDILTRGLYHFTNEMLVYTDFEQGDIQYRKARWTVNADTLSIIEINRPFRRKAFIHYVSLDTLIMSPIIDNKVGDSKLLFVKKKE